MKRDLLPILGLLVLTACNEMASQKADLFGFEPGMTFAEIQAAIAANDYNCGTPPHRAYTDCIIKETKVTVYYSKQLDGNPAVTIAASLAGNKLSDTAQSVAAQYAVPMVAPDSKGNYEWVIGKQNRLQFTGMLVLTDPDLTMRDDAADRKASAGGVPKL